MDAVSDSILHERTLNFLQAARKAEKVSEWVRETKPQAVQAGLTIRVVPRAGNAGKYTLEMLATREREGLLKEAFGLSDDAFEDTFKLYPGDVPAAHPDAVKLSERAVEQILEDARQNGAYSGKTLLMRYVGVDDFNPKPQGIIRKKTSPIAEELRRAIQTHWMSAGDVAEALDARFGTTLYREAAGTYREPRPIAGDTGSDYPGGNEPKVNHARWAERFPTQNASKADIGFSL